MNCVRTLVSPCRMCSFFQDTIEEKILAYGRPGCSFERVKEVAKMADANLFIKNLPDGYDTIVGERGVGLSGGQKQRISLARALLKDPAILVLDDTTSAVDMETESYIQRQLENIGHSCTTFIIAYRISLCVMPTRSWLWIRAALLSREPMRN